MTDLRGKVALVTGAGRGLGWGVARALGLAGAAVCVSDINAVELAQAEADLQADGSTVLGRQFDVADLQAFHAAVAAVLERWGRIDALVHCAIFMPLISFADSSAELFWQQMHVGLGGFFNGAKACWPAFLAQGGGHLIGIASGSSLRGYHDETAYCAIKHGQEGFVKALAIEAAPHQIAVNTVGPGKPIKTTRVTRAELAALPAAQTTQWADPAELGKGFAWLISQPPARFTGLRFDAGVIADTIAAEGEDFAFAPEKVTFNPTDFTERQRWYANYWNAI